MTPADPAATLEEWRSVTNAQAIPGAPKDLLITDVDAWFLVNARTAMPRLIAALEAVLALHRPGPAVILGALCERHDSYRYFSISRTEADAVRSCPDCPATVYASCTGCGPGVSIDACPNRLAITREITGKGESDAAT